MIGQSTPRRSTAAPSPYSSRLTRLRRRIPRFSHLLPVALLLAVLLAGSLAFTGCSSHEGGAGNPDSSTTIAPEGTSQEPVGQEPTGQEPASTTGASEADPIDGTFPVTVTDDNGNSVTIEAAPVRIVSTAPSNTEMLFALGLGDRVVGVTSLDDYPPEVADIPKIGDFQANTEAIMALSPDLVVGYSGNEEALAPVQAAGAAVIIFNPTDLEGIYSNITTLGAATGAVGRAAELVESIKAEIKEVAEAAAATGESPKVFYALDNALWTCGPGSFVDELLSLVSATNIGSTATADGSQAQAYYQFSPEQLLAADPDIILLPDTAYTAAEEFTADTRFAGLSAVKNGRVYVVNDTLITRPGPRIGQGLRLLAEVIHPEAF